MIQKLFVAALLGISLLQPLMPANPLLPVAQASGITTYDGLINSAYWTKQNPSGNQILLDANGVAEFNKKIRESSRSVPDLYKYPASVSGDSLRTMIMDYSILDDELYLHGNKVSENYKNILRAQTNTKAISAKNNVRYAVTVRRTPVRNLPTGEGLFYYAGDTDFDALQETSLDPGEPLIVLHTSANGFFYYVQCVNYKGWVSKYNLAFTDKNTWQNFTKPDKFIVVTAADLTLKVGAEQVLYQQGAILPFVNKTAGYYTVQVPVRDKQGNLQKQNLNVSQLGSVHEGYLPYTSNNVVQSAFKFYGKPYGWGGLKNSVDCSSLLFNAYRTVGIVLPRNADEQEATAGTQYSLTGKSDEQRAETINKLTPGAGLFMDGHCMMYIGKVNNEPYVIHSLGSYVNQNGRQKEMKVVVSDLTLRRASNETFLQSLTSAVEFK